MLYQAETPNADSADRVRRSTAADVNIGIDSQTDANKRRYSGCSREEILRRIKELDREWDIERALEVNASSVALTGGNEYACATNDQYPPARSW